MVRAYGAVRYNREYFMPEPCEAFLESVMGRIMRQTMIPKVQVERAIAPILGLFIAELLSIKWTDDLKLICEEFPLKKVPPDGVATNLSTNIDWLLYSTVHDQLVFLELKTADTSLNREQEDIYRTLIRKVRECGASFLIDDLEDIRCASREPMKYDEVLNCAAGVEGFRTCRKAKLVYIAPAVVRGAHHAPTDSELEWLSFEDLPREIHSAFAAEWRIIRRHLAKLDVISRRSRNDLPQGGGHRNYEDACPFEEVMNLCRENGDAIVVGFDGGVIRLQAATLNELKTRPAFKWDHAETGTGSKDVRNWIRGRRFLEIVEKLRSD